MVSHRRLRQRKSPLAPLARWVLDSGGFSELSMYGEWRTSKAEYVDAVNRYQEWGGMDWAAPQDWMCEPWIVEKTGLSVREHQERTVQNYLDLIGHGPFIPVLQGWELAEYLNHIELYAEAGIDLHSEPVVGIGSVCRRQSTSEAMAIIQWVATVIDTGLHGFGVKTTGLARYAPWLQSADSMAWSYAARRRPPLPGHAHKTCANCMDYALDWRESVIKRGR